MTREYGNKRASRSKGASHQLLMLVVIFFVGYLTATFFDLGTITHWINTQVLASNETKVLANKPKEPKAAIPPKPKFEFYTLLANEKVPASPPAGNNTTTTATQASAAVTAASTNLAAVIPAVAPVKPSSTRTLPPPVALKTAPTKAVAASTQTTVEKGPYLVQVASFKARQDAEHMKGSLILKGFSVYIVPVNHATRGNWFRVVVGPYSNKGLAQQAQINLAKNEHLRGMVTTAG